MATEPDEVALRHATEFAAASSGRAVSGVRAAKVGIGLALLGALGCHESEFELPPTRVVHEGAAVRLHAAEGLEVCGGTGLSMERTMAFLEAELGLGQVATPIDVYALELEDVRAACGVGWAEVFGCSFSSDDGAIYASALPMAHELVHSYVGRARRRGRKGYSFFEEGLAVAYGDDAPSLPPRTDLVEAIGYGSRMPTEHYATAGRFVSFFIDEFTAPAVGRFVLDSSDSMDDDELRVAFERHFGASLEETIDRHSALDSACSAEAWQRIAPCEEDPKPWTKPTLWEADIGADCGSPTAIGIADGFAQERFVFEVAEDQTFELRMEDRSTLARPWVYIHGCAGCDSDVSVVHDLRWGPKDLFLPAGVYVVSASFGERETQPETLGLIPHEGYLWCARADNAKDEDGRPITFDDGTSPEGCHCAPAETHAWMLEHREGAGVTIDGALEVPAGLRLFRDNIYRDALNSCYELAPEGLFSNCLDEQMQGGALDADADADGFQHPPLVFGDRNGVQRCAPDSFRLRP